MQKYCRIMNNIHIIRDKKTNFTSYMQICIVQILHNYPKFHTNYFAYYSVMNSEIF